MLITRHITIRGQVQGVGFRHYFSREARRNGVNGWVRNRRDGSVEAVVHGALSAVEAVIAWARHGPPSARVTELHVTECEGAYETFETLPTE
jgi:acylphosphatase